MLGNGERVSLSVLCIISVLLCTGTGIAHATMTQCVLGKGQDSPFYVYHKNDTSPNVCEANFVEMGFRKYSGGGAESMLSVDTCKRLHIANMVEGSTADAVAGLPSSAFFAGIPSNYLPIDTLGDGMDNTFYSPQSACPCAVSITFPRPLDTLERLEIQWYATVGQDCKETQSPYAPAFSSLLSLDCACSLWMQCSCTYQLLLPPCSLSLSLFVVDLFQVETAEGNVVEIGDVNFAWPAFVHPFEDLCITDVKHVNVCQGSAAPIPVHDDHIDSPLALSLSLSLS
eukprot:TRINITY_DN15534_c0_g1_i9.p1 TRINITY_DN15534_c0_g1~~TRINITY_DN15534_c0_g1_i9.p1  ORF type:complete len:285 (+),score=39.43 TRINITY_DN15534_c0_g1_i9:356-1210(+)